MTPRQLMEMLAGENNGVQIMGINMTMCNGVELTADQYIEQVAGLIAIEREIKHAMANPVMGARLGMMYGMAVMIVSEEPEISPRLQRDKMQTEHSIEDHSATARATADQNENVRKAAQVYGMFTGPRGVLSVANAARVQPLEVIDDELNAHLAAEQQPAEQARMGM